MNLCLNCGKETTNPNFALVLVQLLLIIKKEKKLKNIVNNVEH